LHRELAFAGELQKYLFPQKMPVSERYTISARYTPSSTISGDFYDYHLLGEDRLSLLIADVSGHGYAAGLVAAMVKVAYQETIEKMADVKTHQKEMNRILFRHVSNAFVTAINIQIDPSKQCVQYTRSGHSPLLHYKRKSHTIEELSPAGMPLAVLPNYKSEMVNIFYEPGDRIFLYTDGLIEEVNSEGEEYGVERVMNQLLEKKDLGPDELSEHITQSIINWKDKEEFEDDVTFVIIDFQ